MDTLLSSSSKFHAAIAPHILTILFFYISNGASGTNITFVNNCEFTVWPGIWGNSNFSTTGFELTEGNSISFEAPSEWTQGRIWGSTGCNFDVSGNGSCTSGDCGTGEVECNGNVYEPPATIAEFTLNPFQGPDYYDVSLVDGYNLPMLVEPTGGSGSGLRSCAKTGCINDLLQRCPSELRSGGGCSTACQAFGSPEYCCKSSFNSPTTCKPTAYAQLFKAACPRSYSTTFDDSSATLFMCNSADYTIRFCPPSDSFSTMKLGSQLKSTDQLVSILGNFTLGFDEDSKYLGIWYTNDVESKKV